MSARVVEYAPAIAEVGGAILIVLGVGMVLGLWAALILTGAALIGVGYVLGNEGIGEP
ncbi:MAG: hypothetical protein AB7F65_02860 [Dehalococcoidia bacterium]